MAETATSWLYSQFSWLYSQFDKLAQMRPDMVESVLQRAMQADAEFRWAMVVGAYLETV